MATQNTLTGTLFAGRYRVTRKLGGGGMADVYLAEDQELGRRVAVKILHNRYQNDVQFVERFRREATHAAGLSHPNIVAIFDRGEVDGSYFIVMEYVEGRTLKELIRSRGPCPIPVAIAYTRQILSALRYAHRNGVVHRDIKPHNVIVDPEGVVKVTDFGIARAGASQMTEEGAIIGTAQYLSPEQARGAPVDQTSDLYSTGIVLYELLTARVPFSGESPVEIAMKHIGGDAEGSVRPTPGGAGRPRPRRPARALEGAQGALPVCVRDGLGSRDRRPWRPRPGRDGRGGDPVARGRERRRRHGGDAGREAAEAGRRLSDGLRPDAAPPAPGLAVAGRCRRAARAAHRRIPPLRHDQRPARGSEARRRAVRRGASRGRRRSVSSTRRASSHASGASRTRTCEEGVVIAQNPTEGTRVEDGSQRSPSTSPPGSRR